MAELIVQVAFVISASWILWYLLRLKANESSLRELRGPPGSLLLGNILEVFHPDGLPWQYEAAKNYGGAFKIMALLGQEMVYITDPHALHHILVEDQSVYELPPTVIESQNLMFGKNLFGTLGQDHKRLRRVVSPAFSPAAIRNLFRTFYVVAEQLRNELVKQVAGRPTELEMSTWMSLTALECIGQGGIGQSFDVFSTQGQASEYAWGIKHLLPTIAHFSLFFPILPYLVKLGPPSFRRFLWELVPSKSMRTVTRCVDVMSSNARDLFEAKKKAFEARDGSFQQQVSKAKDIISVLMQANTATKDADRLSDDELRNQMNAFVFAANDTTSGALSRMLHVLATHPVEQTNLRRELTNIKAAKGTLGYDDIVTLPCLDAIVRETLRLYPPAPYILRRNRITMILPLSTPVQSAKGTPLQSLHLPAQTDIIVGSGAANRNPAIWGEDADEWKPERWLGRNVAEVTGRTLPGIYSGMMTFSGGRRSCIGYQVAILEIKIVLSLLVESFEFGEIPGKEIVWRNGLLQYPSLRESPPGQLLLPLRVSKVASMEE